MYYEEKEIDGFLCWRTDPHGEWIKMEYAEIVCRYKQYKDNNDKLWERLVRIKEAMYLLIGIVDNQESERI